MYTLSKHPSETLTYVMDFAADGPPAGARASTWPQGHLLAAGESLSGVPTIGVRRDDGQASDLTLTNTSTSGSQILFTVAGGQDGVTYTLTAQANTSSGETRVGEGALVVSLTLP